MSQDGMSDGLVGTVIDRVGGLQAGERVESDAYFARPFVREHTQFDSFREFAERSRWSVEDPAEIRHVSRDNLDDYVAETTEFSSWEEMEACAAQEEIVDQLVS